MPRRALPQASFSVIRTPQRTLPAYALGSALLAALLDGLFEHRVELGRFIPDFKMTDFGKEISSVISSLAKSDLKGALPYLILTSKSESIIRDHVAFRLHDKFQAKHYAVAREWSYKKEQTKPRGRVDIAILKSCGRGEKKRFKEPKAILEAKMVAAPGKKGKSVIDHINSLAGQLVNRKKRWSNAKCFGLLVVRNFRETYQKSTSAFDEVIVSRKKSLRSPSDLDQLDQIVRKQLKKLRPPLVELRTKTLMLGEDKFLHATAKIKWWLFSLQ